MTKASDNAFPSVLITEGTEPSAPAAGKQRLYIDSTTHKLKRTDSSGTDVTIEAGAATITTKDEGSTLSSTVTTLDFVGTGVTATGSGATTTVTISSGGGGLAQSFVGYNTVGASAQALAANVQYMKQVVLGANSQLQSIDAYLQANTDNFGSVGAVVLTDVSNVPTLLIGAVLAPPILMSNTTTGLPHPGRWLSVPMGTYLAAGTYWIGLWSNTTFFNIFYDTGTDVTSANTASYAVGKHTSVPQTTTARKFSIRASILS